MFKYDAFLSYSSTNKSIVNALAKRLKQDGVRVWLDAWFIQPGDPIYWKIQEGLENSHTLLMCMSPAYFGSDWATLENQTRLFRDPMNKKRRLIPLLIEDCTPPDIIAQFAYIDWRKRTVKAYKKILDSLRTYLQVDICATSDVFQDMEKVSTIINELKEPLGKFTVHVDVRCWELKGSDLNTQYRVFAEIADSDLVIFLLYNQLDPLIMENLDTTVKNFSEKGYPKMKFWFKYVPKELEANMKEEYNRLLDFKENTLSKYSLMDYTYKNEDYLAISSPDNNERILQHLAYQELFHTLLESGTINQGKTRKYHSGVMTRDMIINYWKLRAKRPGVAAVMSDRYKEDVLEQASKDLVNFVLEKTREYIEDKSVIEFGSGIGRFTLPISKIAKSLTAVDMCPEMAEIAKKRLGDSWDQIQYIPSFVEDLENLDRTYDCSFSCLLFIHILDKNNLRHAIDNVKASSNIAIICEHTDKQMQNEVSNITRIWPSSLYEKFFGNDFKKIRSFNYNHLGDNLELMIFQRKTLLKESQLSRIPERTQYRDKESIPEEWNKWYNLFRFSNVVIPYQSFFGPNEKQTYEFTLDQLIISQNEDMYNYPGTINDEEEILKKVIKSTLQESDYLPRDETKARVDKIKVCKTDPFNDQSIKMYIQFKQVTYYQYLVVREKLKDVSDNFRKNYTANQLSLNTIDNLKTTNIGGCGVFILTQDNYIILSSREKVAEYPEVIGYSASGSISWNSPKDLTPEANPFLTVVRKTKEEIGVQLNEKDLLLFAVGTDIKHFYIQFSFYIKVEDTADKIIEKWKSAFSKSEQQPFPVPLNPEALSKIIVSYSMEPAAAATLIQLSCKLFGHENFEQCMKKLYSFNIK
jgi:2-polyprenyl-3-methyl-5-hydroxy-6-metoxy-1,4-benzoquinol methylase